MNTKIFNIPFFQNSVRVFFPLAALLAVCIPMYTVTVIVNQYPFANHIFNIFEWHGFEMLFGFFYTLIIGFTLTAGAHWTGQKPIQGFQLFVLFGLWTTDQLALFFSSRVELLFLTSLILALFYFYSLYQTLNNYPQKIKFLFITSIISILKLSYISLKFFKSYQIKNYIYDYTLLILCFLALIIAGRVVPNFTKNFFKDKQRQYLPPTWLNNLTTFTLISLFLTPLISTPYINFSLYFLAGLFCLLKIYWYNTAKAITHSIIGMLHVGYIVLATGLILRGLSFVWDHLDNTKASLHLLLTGGISILGLNIMLRATLGHTGRVVQASLSIKAMYFFIVIGALIRYIVPVIFPDKFLPSLHHSMGYWTMAFLIYLLTHAHMCFKPRVDV